MRPVWSPDGKWIAFTARRNDQFGLFRKHSDGSGTDELLLTSAQQITAEDWSRDGKFLIYSERTEENHARMFLLRLEGDRKPSLVVARGTAGRFSPDAHWLTYNSSESGTNEVYVVALGGAQSKWQVSANGGQQPHWSKDGRELYYMDLTLNLLSVPVKDAGSALQFGAPQTLIRNWSTPQVFYDITPDNKKILLERVAQQISQSVTVVTNFTSELEK
jgi:Tol biopolymer transport system component